MPYADCESEMPLFSVSFLFVGPMALRLLLLLFLSTRLIDGGEMLRIEERERKRHQKASCGMQSYLHSQSARLNI